MTYYNPIFDDITKLPDNLIIPKTECDYSYVIVESDPKVVFKFRNQNIVNICYPVVTWQLYAYKDIPYTLGLSEYYDRRNNIEKEAIDFANLQNVSRLKPYYTQLQCEILNSKKKQAFLNAQNVLLNKFRELQAKCLDAGFDLDYCLKAYIPVYLLNNGQLITLKPKRDN